MSDKDTLLVRRAGEENRNETLLEEGRFVDSVKTYNHWCVPPTASSLASQPHTHAKG